MYEFGNFIEGTWTPGQGKPFSTCNPARPAEKVGAYSAASAEQVDGAVAAAARAQTKWGVRPAVERGQELTRFVNALEEMSEQIAIAITREQGKPLAESRGEVAKACGEARFMIGEASRSHGTVMPSSRPGFSNMVTRRPRGVIAALSPWNFPIMTPMRKIMPALVFGNAVILKPSEYAPAAACMVADAAKDFLPPGLLQIVLGMVEPGQAMVSHPGIDGITFTGSAAVGKKIYGAAAQHLAEVSLELGGKNAAVIHDVNDLDSCLDQIVSAAYQCAGQRCTGISRVVVDAGLKDRVVAGLVDRVGRIRVGDGMLDVAAIGRSEHGLIRIGIYSSIASGFLPELLRRYGNQYPKVQIDLIDDNPAEHVTSIRQLKLDAAFVTGEREWPDCERVSLWSERVFVVLPEDHRLVERDEVGWDQLAKENFIVNEAPPGQEIHDYLVQRLAALGHHPEIRVQHVGRENLLPLVALNRGLTAVSEAMTAAQFPGISYRPITGEVLPFSALWSSKNDNPALLQFLELARSMGRSNDRDAVTAAFSTIEVSAEPLKMPDQLQ